MRYPSEPHPSGSRFVRLFIPRFIYTAVQSTRVDPSGVIRNDSSRRSFLTGDRKCLSNSTVARTAVLGTAAAITTICRRRVIALAHMLPSKIGRNGVQLSCRAVGVTYARSFRWFAQCRRHSVVRSNRQRCGRQLRGSSESHVTGCQAAFVLRSAAPGNGNQGTT